MMIRRWWLFAVCLIATVPAWADFAAAPLPNAGLEDGDAHWAIHDDVSLVTADATRTGKMGLRVGDPQYYAPGSSVYSSQFPVTPGQKIAFSFWARATSANTGVYLTFFGGDGKMVGSPPHCPIDKVGNEWTQYSRDAEVPARAATVSLWVHSYAGASGTVDLDDFAFTGLAPDAAPLPPKAARVRKAEATPDPKDIPPRAKPPVIILKFDDLRQVGGKVHARWQKLADYLEAKQIKGSIGVICETLGEATPTYVQWIKSRQDSGQIEFWFHGWDHAVHEVGGTKYNEFNQRFYDEQKQRVTKSQQLAKEKLGFAFRTFGPPGGVGSASFTEDTLRVMAEDPDINVMLYPAPLNDAGRKIQKNGGLTILDRVWAVNTESVVGVPDFKAFLRGYVKNLDREYFVLQGHPAAWTEERFAEFTRIIDFLVEQKAVFVTPTEFAGVSSGTAPPIPASPPKPTDAASAASVGSPVWFPFVIPWDDAEPGTATDVSFLNTAPAGSRGRIVVRDGHFVEEQTGRSIRFLGTNLTAKQNFPTHEDAEKVARRMAKYGINIVRLHHIDNSWDLAKGSGIWKADGPRRQELDPAQLDKLDYLVSQLKARGIYVNINLKVSKSLTEADGFPASIKQLTSYQKRVDQFEPRMIELQKDFARKLLTHVNPYTGLSYAEDPAVAVVEINNENSLVGYPSTLPEGGLDALPEPFRGELARQWNAWLAKRYADDQALTAAWAIAPASAEVPEPIDAQAQWSVGAQKSARMNLSFPSGDKTVLGGEPQVAVSQTDGTDWHAQLHARGLNLLDGQVYTLTFRAKASAPHKCRVAVMRDQDDFRNNGLQQSFSLSTDWKDFRFIFTTRGIKPGHTRLTFNLGAAPATAWFTDVRIEPGAPGQLLGDGESLQSRTIDLPAQAVGAQGRDWVQFLLDTERNYAEEMRRFLRDELNVRANIVDSQITWGGLTAYDREAGMDLIDNHVYWQHPRFPGKPWDRSNWTIQNNALVNAWATDSLGTLPGLALTRQLGKPFSVSEYDHPAPNDFAAEAIPLASGFAALQDWDAIYSFEYGPYGQAAATDRINGFFDNANHPAKFAFYPAAAMLFRAGLLSPLPAQHVLALPPRPYEHDRDAPGAWRRADAPLNVVEFFTHRWALDLAPKQPVDHPTVVTHAASEASSSTSVQFRRLDGGGLWIAHAPAAVVVVGMVGGQTVQVGDAQFEFGTFPGNFAALILTAMDAQPLDQSRRILLTVASRAENQGMGWNAQRTSVSNRWGEGPVQMAGVPLRVSLRNTAARQVYALDPSGRRATSVATETADGLGFSVDPQHATPWYELATE